MTSCPAEHHLLHEAVRGKHAPPVLPGRRPRAGAARDAGARNLRTRSEPHSRISHSRISHSRMPSGPSARTLLVASAGAPRQDATARGEAERRRAVARYRPRAVNRIRVVSLAAAPDASCPPIIVTRAIAPERTATRVMIAPRIAGRAAGIRAAGIRAAAIRAVAIRAIAIRTVPTRAIASRARTRRAQVASASHPSNPALQAGAKVIADTNWRRSGHERW
jgi:hypothetical protein